jgi:hypothetical protein
LISVKRLPFSLPKMKSKGGFMAASKRSIGKTVRGITLKALERGELDRAALRRVTDEVRKNLKRFEHQLAKDLQAARRAGRDAAAQGVSVTLASSAMAARAAAGMFAGIADALAEKQAARRR